VDSCSPGRHLTPFGFDALRDGLDPRFMGQKARLTTAVRFLGGTRRGRRGVIPAKNGIETKGTEAALLRGILHIERLVWPLVIVAVDEVIELGLLLQEVAGGRLGGLQL
jgi:hypothetical protein